MVTADIRDNVGWANHFWSHRTFHTAIHVCVRTRAENTVFLQCLLHTAHTTHTPPVGNFHPMHALPIPSNSSVLPPLLTSSFLFSFPLPSSPSFASLGASSLIWSTNWKSTESVGALWQPTRIVTVWCLPSSHLFLPFFPFSPLPSSSPSFFLPLSRFAFYLSLPLFLLPSFFLPFLLLSLPSFIPLPPPCPLSSFSLLLYTFVESPLCASTIILERAKSLLEKEGGYEK